MNVPTYKAIQFMIKLSQVNSFPFLCYFLGRPRQLEAHSQPLHTSLVDGTGDRDPIHFSGTTQTMLLPFFER